MFDRVIKQLLVLGLLALPLVATATKPDSGSDASSASASRQGCSSGPTTAVVLNTLGAGLAMLSATQRNRLISAMHLVAA
mmetsp:Transcript_146962/g.471802  ORF Transcript_146962/g.471802 Transcript_146962/m.471802 type:complete len:80 (-) Transcript_146962:154-393(-)